MDFDLMYKGLVGLEILMPLVCLYGFWTLRKTSKGTSLIFLLLAIFTGVIVYAAFGNTIAGWL